MLKLHLTFSKLSLIILVILCFRVANVFAAPDTGQFKDPLKDRKIFDSYMWYKRGNYEFRFKNNPQKAIEYLHKAIQIQPSNQAAQDLLIELQGFFVDQDQEKHQKIKTVSFDEKVSEAEKWFQNGKYLYWKKDYQEALRCFEKALSYNPLHVKAIELKRKTENLLPDEKKDHSLNNTDIDKRKLEFSSEETQAEEMLRKSFELYQRARFTLENLGNPSEAEKILMESLKLNPQNKDSLKLSEEIQLSLKKVENEKNSLEVKESTSLAGTFDHWFWLGRYYFEVKKDYEQALTCFQKAYILNPSSKPTEELLNSAKVKVYFERSQVKSEVKSISPVEMEKEIPPEKAVKREFEIEIQRYILSKEEFENLEIKPQAYIVLTDHRVFLGSLVGELRGINKEGETQTFQLDSLSHMKFFPEGKLEIIKESERIVVSTDHQKFKAETIKRIPVDFLYNEIDLMKNENPLSENRGNIPAIVDTGAEFEIISDYAEDEIEPENSLLSELSPDLDRILEKEKGEYQSLIEANEDFEQLYEILFENKLKSPEKKIEYDRNEKKIEDIQEIEEKPLIDSYTKDFLLKSKTYKEYLSGFDNSEKISRSSPVKRIQQKNREYLKKKKLSGFADYISRIKITPTAKAYLEEGDRLLKKGIEEKALLSFSMGFLEVLRDNPVEVETLYYLMKVYKKQNKWDHALLVFYKIIGELYLQRTSLPDTKNFSKILSELDCYFRAMLVQTAIYQFNYSRKTGYEHMGKDNYEIEKLIGEGFLKPQLFHKLELELEIEGKKIKQIVGTNGIICPDMVKYKVNDHLSVYCPVHGMGPMMERAEFQKKARQDLLKKREKYF